MVSLEQSLKSIVSLYAIGDPSTGTYQVHESMNKSTTQKIEAHLITFFSQYLTQEGMADDMINLHCKELRKRFHPDKLKNTVPEIVWLEQVISEGAMNGACFKLIDLCAESVKSTPVKDDASTSYDNVDNMDDFLHILQKRRNFATTLTQRAVIDSMISMLQRVNHYHATTVEIETGWLQKTIQAMPYISSGFCVGLYIKELALLYALTYSISLGSRWLGKSSSQRWQGVAYGMNGFSQSISSAATTLLASLVKLNFYAFDGVCYVGIGACSAVYRALTLSPAPASVSGASSSSSSQPGTTMILAPQHLLGGKAFKTLELKLLSLNLEGYQMLQKEQYFAGMRAGKYKSTQMASALTRLQLIDKNDCSVEHKLGEAKAVLDALASNRRVIGSGSHARQVIHAAQVMCQMLLPARDHALESEDDDMPGLFPDDTRMVLFS